MIGQYLKEDGKKHVTACSLSWKIACLLIALCIRITSAQAQSSGTTVSQCSTQEVDSANNVEQTVCITGDASYLDYYDAVDEYYNSSSSVDEVGADAQLYKGPTYIADTGEQQGSYTDASGWLANPQIGVWYTVVGYYDECQDPGNYSCYWTGLMGGSSLSVQITAPPAPTVSLSTSATPSLVDQAVTFTAHVNGSAGSPTGNVSFFADGSAIGMSALYAAITTNLVPYSQQFGSAPWYGYCGSTSNMSSNTGDLAAPDGTQTATKFVTPSVISCGASASLGVLSAMPSGLETNQTYTVSVWLRGAAGGEWISFGLNDCATVGVQLTTSWQRYTHVFSSISPSITECEGGYGIRGFEVVDGQPNQTYYVWGAQTEQAGTAGPYVATGPTQASISSGQIATLDVDTLSAGTHTITAQYSGDSEYAATGSNAVTQVVNAPVNLIYGYSILGPGSVSGYAANGNITAYADSVNGIWSMAGGYDSLNRLTAASSSAGPFQGVGVSWSYDSFGNRKSETFSGGSVALPTNTTASYNDGTNHVTGSSLMGGGPLGYDAAGDVSADNVNQYLYDGDGQLCGTRNLSSGAMTGYLYDAGGNRVGVGTLNSWSCDTSPGNFTLARAEYLGLGGEQLTEVDGSGNWRHTNVYAAGELLATYDTSGLHFQLSDWLGTKRVETDYTGNVTQRCTNLPFGNTNTQCSGPSEQFFTGKERDPETTDGNGNGNDYFGARYYGSSAGRFLTPDWSAKFDPVPYAKLDNPQSLNLYTYVLNSPLGGVDPDGHQCGTPGYPRSACDSEGEREKQIEESKQQAKAQQQTGTSNEQKRSDLAEAARAEYGSKEWNPKGGVSKCNIFVCDVLDKVGLDGPRNPNGHPIAAADWANKKHGIENWRVLGPGESPLPGDVAAVAEPGAFRNATGHAGIVSEIVNGTPYIIAAGTRSVYNTKASDFVPGYAVTYRRYTGQ